MTDARRPPHPAQCVDRSRPITLTFEGRRIAAYEGESAGAALYAAGARIFSRSFKYHRPRGLLCVAGRCPNCLMEVDGVPNVRTCVEPARDGMRVRSQHAWPSLERDCFAWFDWLDRFLPVGFYYKTFIHPTWLWPTYERVLRHLAGLGRLDVRREPNWQGERVHLFVDLAVVGGGPAGIAAALEAARLGVEVVLVDDEPELGGHLRWTLLPDGGPPGYERARALADRVRAEPKIRLLTGATAFGLYEDGLLGVAQAHRLYKVRAQRIIVATGGFESPLVFQHNDRPGIFVGQGLQRLVALYGIDPGRRAIVVTNGRRGLRLARELLAAGVHVTTVADARPNTEECPDLVLLRDAGVSVLHGRTILEAHGRRRVRSVILGRLDSAGTPVAGSREVVDCDLVAVAAAWEPATPLLAQGGARLEYRVDRGAFFPVDLPSRLFAAGEVRGVEGLAAIEHDGRHAGLQAALSLGAGRAEDRTVADELGPQAWDHLGKPAPGPGISLAESKRFVCLCEDVTDKDLGYAVSEGFRNLETLKRYTTVTMGPCQGKMCQRAAIEIFAGLTERSPAATGMTTARPPVKPVTFGVLAGSHHAPVKRTPLHHAHAALGATWMDMGPWKRPLVYTSVEDECRAVHEQAGVIDVSTLGKLAIKGRDAGGFLDWIHPNRFSDLKVGRVRYRAMLDESATIVDDGTIARLGEEDFFLTTGSGALEQVQEWLDWWLADGDRCVHVTDLTGALAAVNLAGPRSRDVLSQLTDLDLSPQALPYLAAVRGTVAGMSALILRIGFVGELGYEMHVASEHGQHLWECLLQAGREFGVAPFGVEAQRVLRLEKQHLIPGHDTDALSNPLEAGMSWVVKLDKPDFVGRAALTRLQGRPFQLRLVGFEMPSRVVPGEGGAIVANGVPAGRVTSAKWSARLGRTIGMAWVPPALAYEGREIDVRLDGTLHRARVVTKAFYDPDGERLRS